MGTKPMTRDEAARHLAELQVRVDPSMTVFRVWTPGKESESEPIKFLQVTEFTFPTEEILPLGFDPTPASGNYPTIVMDVTPEQFEQLKSHQMQLPRGWLLGECLAVGDEASVASNP